MKSIEHIIFDLGGVIIELGGTPIPDHIFPLNEKMTLNEWFKLPLAHEFERGKITSEELASEFIAHFDLDISENEFISYFSMWPKKVYPGAIKVLETLGEKFTLSILSNCNELHWPRMENDFGILKYFNYTFSSHIVGLTKPDKRIFKHILAELDTAPRAVLFFDDNTQNIEAAKKIGINAFLVNGIQEVKNTLNSLKLC